MRHHRRKSSRAGREDQKPTDFRRRHPDELMLLMAENPSVGRLRRRGKIKEIIHTKGKIRYNMVTEIGPRTLIVVEQSDAVGN